jgi:hypothetical protein
VVLGFLDAVPGIVVLSFMHAKVLQHPCCGNGDLDATWIRCAIPSDFQDSIQEETFAVSFVKI